MTHVSDLFADCDYLYLDKLFEPTDNALTIRILEAKSGGAIPEALSQCQTLAPLMRPDRHTTAIEHRSGCRIFELHWPSYIGYSVLNESFASPEPETSTLIGRFFVEYRSSVYLDYLRRASFANDDYPGPYRHWAALCLNHIVDIASADEPSIGCRLLHSRRRVAA